MTVFEARASTILYNLLRSRPDARPFLVPANVCPAVALTFLRARRPFRLVDIGPGLDMDPDRCLELLAGRPGAFGGLLYVRPYGAAGRPESLLRTAKAAQPDLLVVDDRCLSRPNCDGARPAPDADATLFSTGRAKYADLGFGGFAHLRPGVTYRRHRGRYRPEALARMTRRSEAALVARRAFRGGTGAWLQLARPRISWARYRRRVAAAAQAADSHKRRLNAVYAANLPPEIQLPPGFQNWRFNVLVPAPDRLVARLFEAGLFASRHYAPLGGVFGRGRFPAAEAVHRCVVNLFNDRSFDEGMAWRATEVVAAHLAAVARRRRAPVVAAW